MELFEKREKTAEELFDLARKTKKPKKEIKYYTKGLELDPNNVDAWNSKGVTLRYLGKYEEAIRCFDRALEIDSEFILALANKGDALDDLGMHEEAKRYFAKTLEIDPKYTDLLSIFSVESFFMDKRYEETIKYCDRILEFNPKDAHAWYLKGDALAKLGKHEEAISYCDKTLEFDPNNSLIWFFRGDTLAESGRYKEAIEYYNKALEIDQNFWRAKEGKELAEKKLKKEKEKEAGLLWKIPFIPKKSKIRELLKKEDPSIVIEKFSSDHDLIPTLIELLYDSNPNVRKGAAYNIGIIGTHNPDLVKNALPGLIMLLDDSNKDVRSQAAQAIWFWVWFDATPEWFKDAIPKLVNLLIDPSRDVRSSAAQSLGKIGRKKPDLVEGVIPTLIRLLDYPEARREGRVIDVIIGIGEENPDMVKDAFPKLINFLEDVQGHDIHTFMRIGKKRPDLIEGIAPKLSNLLSDEQKIVSNAEVIGFLVQINLDLVKDVISKLKGFLNSSDKEVRKNAVWAIAIIAGRKPELVKDAFPRLIELFGDSDGLTRAWATSAIKVAAEKTPELFKDVVPKLTELLDDSNISVSYDAAIAIGNICGATRLVELLCDFDVREKAISAILHAIEVATKKTPQLFKDAVPKLIELSGDTNLYHKGDRMIAIFALGNICGASALPHLEKLLEDDPKLRYVWNIKGFIEKINKRIETSKQGIESAKRALEEAKAFGCEISAVEDILNKAKSSFYAEYHVNAIRYAREAEAAAKKRKEESKPEITVNLSEYRFLPETWKKIEIFLANKGKAHAKEIKIDSPTEIETKGLQTISNLNVGEEKSLEVGLRPKIIGEIPLDVKIGYKDLDGREYTQSESFWINVALKEESQIGIAEQGMNKLTIERTIYDPCKRDFIEGKFATHERMGK